MLSILINHSYYSVLLIFFSLWFTPEVHLASQTGAGTHSQKDRRTVSKMMRSLDEKDEAIEEMTFVREGAEPYAIKKQEKQVKSSKLLANHGD